MFRVHLLKSISLIGLQADAYSAESWHNQRDPEDIIKVIEKSSNDWDPAVLDFVRQTPVKVVDWRLMWRDSIEQWTSDKGRIIKLGDSAHAFFPTAGNGAVQAQEVRLITQRDILPAQIVNSVSSRTAYHSQNVFIKQALRRTSPGRLASTTPFASSEYRSSNKPAS